MPRSQLVPPSALKLLMWVSSDAACAAVVTGVSGKLGLPAAAGASVPEVNSATRDGVYSNARTKASPAALYCLRCGWTEPDRSKSSATSRPQCAGSGGLSRDTAHVALRRVLLALLVVVLPVAPVGGTLMVVALVGTLTVTCE